MKTVIKRITIIIILSLAIIGIGSSVYADVSIDNRHVRNVGGYTRAGGFTYTRPGTNRTNERYRLNYTDLLYNNWNRYAFCINHQRPAPRDSWQYFNVRFRITVENGNARGERLLGNRNLRDTLVSLVYGANHALNPTRVHQIAYVLSETTAAEQNPRGGDNRSDDYQWALWRVIGQATRDGVPAERRDRVESIVNRSRAYATFVENGWARPANEPVQIDHSRAVLREDGLLGPIFIRHEVYGTGNYAYGHIVGDIRVEGGTIFTGTVEGVNLAPQHSRTIAEAPSEGGWTRIFVRPNEGATEVRVVVYVNDSFRDAIYDVFETTTRRSTGYYQSILMGAGERNFRRGETRIPITPVPPPTEDPPPGINIIKTGSTGQSLNVTFSITITNAQAGENFAITGQGTFIENSHGIIFERVTTNNGQLGISGFERINPNHPIIVEIEEVENPSGYMLMQGVIRIELRTENGEWIQTASKDGTILDSEFDPERDVSFANNVVTINVRNIPEPDFPRINLVKNNLAGQSVDATFSVDITNVRKTEHFSVGGDVIYTEHANGITFTTIRTYNGGFGIVGLEPINEANDVVVVITEVESPAGYILMQGSITIRLRVDADGEWEKLSVDVDGTILDSEFNAATDIVLENNTLALNVRNRPHPGIRLVKTNIAGQSVDATFSVDITNIRKTNNFSVVGEAVYVEHANGITFSSLRTTNGGFGIAGIEPINAADDIVVVITEIASPAGYILMQGSITIRLRVDANGVWQKVSVNADGTILAEEFNPATDVTLVDNVLTLNVRNRPEREPEIPQINLVKRSTTINGPTLAGAIFEVTFTNATVGGENIIQRTTGTDGRINLNNIQIQDRNNPVIAITIREIATPIGYRLLEEPIHLMLQLTGDTWELVNVSAPVGVYVSLDGGIINITVINFPVTETPQINLVKRCTTVDGPTLAGAIFEITFTNATVGGQSVIQRATGVDGLININNIQVQNRNNPVVVTIREIAAPLGYKLLEDPIHLTLQLNGNEWQLINITAPEGVYASLVGSMVNITVINIEDPDAGETELVINKTDIATGQPLANVTYDITVPGFTIPGVTTPEFVIPGITVPGLGTVSETTNSDGQVSVMIPSPAVIVNNPNIPIFTEHPENMPGLPVLSEVVAATFLPENIVITITETAAPVEYKRMIGTIDITLRPQITTIQPHQVWKCCTLGEHPLGALVTPERPHIHAGECNAGSVGRHCETCGYRVLGWQIVWRWVVGGVSKDNTICDDEFSAPVRPERGNSPDVTIIENRINVNIRNIPLMDISGIVWLENSIRTNDGKITGPPNGLYDIGELLVENVRVRLFYGVAPTGRVVNCQCPVCVRTRAEGTANQIGGTAYYNLGGEGRPISFADIRTDVEGYYEFLHVRADRVYRVEFEFDGVNYTIHRTADCCAVNENASHAADTDRRASFNAGFTRVNGNPAIEGANESTAFSVNNGITLNFVHIRQFRNREGIQGGLEVARLVTMDNSGDSASAGRLPWVRESINNIRMGDIREEFRMEAITLNFGPGEAGAEFIRNAGMREREVDVAIAKVLDSARVTINGEEQKYTYTHAEDGTVIITPERRGDSVGFDPNNIARLAIYDSDFHFRISDYVSDANIVRNIEGYYALDQEIVQDIRNNAEELRVWVTYRLEINNQGGILSGNIAVNQVTDMFDANYVFYSAYLADTRGGTRTNLPEGAVQVDNTPIRIYGPRGEADEANARYYRRLTIDLPGTWLGEAGQQFVYITFEVRRQNGEYAINSGEPIRLGVLHNVVEITQYTTEQGVIDRDSAPGNAIVNDGGYRLRIEDDTDRARGIELDVPENHKRTISGLVWEDGRTEVHIGSGYRHGDGIYAEGTEDRVNDVIVQLIEIREAQRGGRTVQFEYIWKETLAGSGRVYSLVNEYTEGRLTYYDVDVGRGGFRFENFIPGNYIVRFIYGDGRVQEQPHGVTDLGYVYYYNGQDFQSTIRSANVPDDGSIRNTAVDNEARRLQVMSESTRIDREMGLILAGGENRDSRVLNLWMCADTTQFHVPIEAIVRYDYGIQVTEAVHNTGVVDGEIVPSFDITRVNFGLQRRPESRLYLLKYVDSVRIATHMGPVILDTANHLVENLRVIGPGRYVDRTNMTMSNGAMVVPGMPYEQIRNSIEDRRLNRGVWHFYTDVDEIIRGANLEVTYRYVIANMSEIDFLSGALVNAYQRQGIQAYATYLEELSRTVLRNMQLGDHVVGRYLGQAYLTGAPGTGDMLVTSRVEEMEEATNNDLLFDVESAGNPGVHFVFDREDTVTIINQSGREILEDIEQVLRTKEPARAIRPMGGVDDSTRLFLTRVLSSSNDSLTYMSHIAEISVFSNAAGRRVTNVIPGTLNDREMPIQDDFLEYTHSYDDRVDMIYDHRATLRGAYSNQTNESWAETVVITNPTGGEDRETNSAILVVIGTSSIVAIGAGVIVIKKFVLKV